MLTKLEIQLSLKARRERGLPRTGVVFYDPFDTITASIIPYTGWNQKQTALAGDITVSAAQARVGGNSMRCEVNYANMYNGSWRSELRFAKENNTVNKWENWCAFSIYLPTGSWAVENQEEVLWQAHASEDVGDIAISPPISVQLRNGNFYFDIRSDSRPVQDGVVTNVSFPIGAATYDQWVDFIVYHKFSWANDGRLKVWKYVGGTTPSYDDFVVDYTGPNAFNDAVPPYHKLGIYKSSWDNGVEVVSQRICYYDEVRYGDSTCSYKSIHVTGASAPAAPLISVAETVTMREPFSNYRGTTTNNRLGWSVAYNSGATAGSSTLCVNAGAGSARGLGVGYMSDVAAGYMIVSATANTMLAYTFKILNVDRTTRTLSRIKFLTAHDSTGWDNFPVIQVGGNWYLWDYATKNNQASSSGTTDSTAFATLTNTVNCAISGNKWRLVTLTPGSALSLGGSDISLPSGNITGIAVYSEKSGTAAPSKLRYDCFEIFTTG